MSPLRRPTRPQLQAASTGTQRVLDVVPQQLHQRVPLYIGSRRDVETAQKMLAQSPSAANAPSLAAAGA